MGRLFKQYLNGPKVYSCSGCRTHLADHEDIISKAFQGRHGRAFLFSSVVNTTMGPKEERLLMTGLHTVADIQCTCCNTVLGWKYEQAFEESQKYKEGKYILEKAKVMKEDLDDEEEPEDNQAMHPPPRIVDSAHDAASRRPHPRVA